jgi:hypothetical protein
VIVRRGLNQPISMCSDKNSLVCSVDGPIKPGEYHADRFPQRAQPVYQAGSEEDSPNGYGIYKVLKTGRRHVCMAVTFAVATRDLANCLGKLSQLNPADAKSLVSSALGSSCLLLGGPHSELRSGGKTHGVCSARAFCQEVVFGTPQLVQGTDCG